MGMKINGVSIPIFGISWEYTESEKTAIKNLFIFLESKRLLVDPIKMELPDECALSAIEIKKFIVDLLINYTFSIDTENCLKSMLDSCNEYLNGLKLKERDHIIYKNQQGDWFDAKFSMIMKKFRSIFRNNIEVLSNNFNLTFNKKIPQEY